MEERHCLHCGKKLLGRIDKKYCDDYCRNAYNNSLNSQVNNVVKEINNLLKKNRRILEQIIPQGEQLKRIHKDLLLKQGFNFKYYTHQVTNQKQQHYFFVYDFGYLPLEENWYLIVKSK